MASISILLRQFYLPNPFENLENGVLYNMGAELILYPLTFSVVGLFYNRGEAPALGSFLYLLFYYIHTGLLMAMGYFDWNKIAIGIIIVLYILILVVINKIRDALSFGW